jgi:type IV secretory pathway VirB2 component (pilin)
MDILIILKWLTNYQGREGQAPSVISTMINMALNGGKVAPGQSLIGSESTNQLVSELLLGTYTHIIILIVVALICAPWMLFAKPLFLRSLSRIVRTGDSVFNRIRTFSILRQRFPGATKSR